MDQDYSNFDSILHHVDALRSKWSGLGEKCKSLQFSLNKVETKLEETRAELESNRIRAIKAENERDNMMHILKELYKEKRLTNPFSESLNKLERIILASQNNTKQKNNSFESIIDDIPSTLAKSIVISDSSSDNNQQRSVNFMSFENETINTNNESNLNQDDRSLISNKDTSVRRNCTRFICTLSTPMIYSDQHRFSNNVFGQYTNAEHGSVTKNESFYEFIDSECELESSEVTEQNNQEDIDPLSVPDEVDCIQKQKPVNLLENDDIQQGTYRTKMWDMKEVKVSLPRIDVSNVLLQKFESNDDSSADIQEVYSSSIRLKKSNHCVICNETFANLPDLKKHMNQVHNKACGPFKCQICGLVLRTMQGFHKHRCQKRCDRKINKKSSTSVDSLRLPGNYNKCKICLKENPHNEADYGRRDLNVHILQSHSNPYPEYVRCPHQNAKCTSHFTSFNSYRSHVRLHHREEDLYIPSEKFFPGLRRLSCSVCGKQFLYKNHLERHSLIFCKQVNKTTVALRNRHYLMEELKSEF